MATRKPSQAQQARSARNGSSKARQARKTKVERRGRGRPPALEANAHVLKQIETNASFQCTKEEIAGALGVSDTTFRKFLRENPEAQQALDTGKANGRLSLRQTQYRVAQKGNVPMLIHLGKSYLGQGDVIVVEDGEKRLAAAREANANAREIFAKLLGGAVDANGKALSDTVAAGFLNQIRDPEDPSSEAA